jgi:hypothetical protein
MSLNIPKDVLDVSTKVEVTLDTHNMSNTIKLSKVTFERAMPKAIMRTPGDGASIRLSPCSCGASIGAA